MTDHERIEWEAHLDNQYTDVMWAKKRRETTKVREGMFKLIAMQEDYRFKYRRHYTPEAAD